MSKVLVVEDEVAIIRLYQLHFRRNGIEGFFFDRVKPAIKELDSIVPDVAVLDVDLPDGVGLQVLEALKASSVCKEVPVIFVTSRFKPSVEMELKEAGAVEVIGKPFSPVKLVQHIKTLLNKDIEGK
ncbi:response regulator transcription factor [Rubellicoccus peritrichatus]|uniref:Response regulator n=1 Tax=Rubellicoccus peritrichatus TaxID=3080537 RepID=A0AAQ3LCN6_9BACT|nr:response regulator [Puniceicoccus sp. CR14]WOO42009.1 response regulator [Puniceicoccus sp. CR14]